MIKKNSIQIYPSKNFKIAIDQLSRKVFGSKFRNGETIQDTIVESRKKKIISNVTLINGTGKDIQLTEFDRAVFDVCLSAMIQNDDFISPRTIFHQLGGGHVLTVKMRKAILDSIERLACVRVRIDMYDAIKKNIVKPVDNDTTFTGYLLPTETLETTINGQRVTAIHFLSKGILYFIADMKNQITTCPQDLLNPPVRATTRTISIRHFLLRRILEIKGSHDYAVKNKRVYALRNIITFQDLYEKCGIPLDDKSAKHDARDIATVILNFFVEHNIIKKFYFQKDGKKIHSISLIF